MEEFTLQKCLHYSLLPDQRHSALILIKRFHECMEENSIVYWATGGTIIGHVLHGTMIPWDDDFDLVIYKEDYDKVKLLISEFCTRYPEYKWRKFEWGPHNSGFKIEPIGKLTFFIDIFVSHDIIINNEECICTKSYNKIDNTFRKKDLFNLDGSISTYSFGYGYIKAAHTPESYLDTFYPGYRVKAHIYNHKIFKDRKIIYSLSDKCLLEINEYFKGLDKTANSTPDP